MRTIISMVLLMTATAQAGSEQAWRRAFVDEWRVRVPAFAEAAQLNEDIEAEREFYEPWEKRYRAWLERNHFGKGEPPEYTRRVALRLLRRFERWVETTRNASDWKREISRTLSDFLRNTPQDPELTREFVEGLMKRWANPSGPWGKILASLSQGSASNLTYADFVLCLAVAAPFAPADVVTKPNDVDTSHLVREVLSKTIAAGRQVAATELSADERVLAYRDFFFAEKLSGILHTWHTR